MINLYLFRNSSLSPWFRNDLCLYLSALLDFSGYITVQIFIKTSRCCILKGKVRSKGSKPFHNSCNVPKEAEINTFPNKSFLPKSCNPGGMIIIFILAIQCRYCCLVFYLCRSCYRGQCYCSDSCRSIAQREAHRKAQQRYRQTEKGRIAHSRAEQRRRLKKNSSCQKNMDDEGSTPTDPCGNLLVKQVNNPVCCCCCGVIGLVVETFPRRGYGRRPFLVMQCWNHPQEGHYGQKTASQPRTCP